jgi:integrase
MAVALPIGTQLESLPRDSLRAGGIQVAEKRRARKGHLVAHWNPVRKDWGTRIELPTEPGQDRQRKWIRAKTEQECLAKARQAQGQLLDLGVVTDDSGTLGAVAREWLRYMESRVSDGSWNAYRTRVENHIIPLLGSRRLTALTTRDVDQFQKDLEARGLAVSTRREIRSTLVIVIEWAQGRDLVLRNVAALSPGPRGSSRKVTSLTKAEARAVLDSVTGWRYEAAVLLMMMTGLRIGETLGLRWGDIAGGSVTISGQLVTKPSLHYQPFPKTGESYRTVALPQRVISALEAHRPAGALPSDYVFLTATRGVLVDPSTLAQELKTRTHSLGVNVHPHKLRHTAASLMIDAKVPIETVSKVLGHKSIRTTLDIYGHLLDGGRDAAASAMDEVLG